MFLSPSPLSLFCALLLCFPLAIIFTIITPSPTATVAALASRQNNVKALNFLLLLNRKTKIPFSPPPQPPPPEDDESLLNVAAQVSATPLLPKKVAFLFLTTTPLPFAPLWELFFNGTDDNLFNIYVHADPCFIYDPPFSGVFARRLIHSKPSKRQTPTLVSAARRLLAHALLHDPSNAMFALLSPSCIPLHSFDFVYRTLTSSNQSFLEILSKEEGAYERWAARGEEAMLPEVRFEDFRIGSQFWVLTRQHAKVVVSDRAIWRKFNQTCVRLDTCYPDEHYFSTLVHMMDPRGSVSATLTRVDWKGGTGGGHPRMYTASEVGPELIRRFREERPRYGYEEINGSDWSVVKRNDPFLFARKFAPDSIQPLMSIAEDTIFND